MLVVTRIALLPLGRLFGQLRVGRLRRRAAATLAQLRLRVAVAVATLRGDGGGAAAAGGDDYDGARPEALPPRAALAQMLARGPPALPALALRVDRAAAMRWARYGGAWVARGLWRAARVLLLWARVALWVLVFSVLWGASLALVVLATTWVAFDLLAVPGQDLDSVLARLKQVRLASPPGPSHRPVSSARLSTHASPRRHPPPFLPRTPSPPLTAALLPPH